MGISLDLRRRVRDAYRKGLTESYDATAEMFGIGRATVGRILRRDRDTGDVQLKPRGGNNPRVVDLEWLRRHAEAEPDARLVDRVEAWVAQGGRRVGIEAMNRALHAIGWTHKKKRLSPGSATSKPSKRDAKLS
jgi:transposase